MDKNKTKGVLKNRLIVTIISLAMIASSFLFYLSILRMPLQSLLDIIPLPNPIIGGTLGVIFALPGMIFGYYFDAYGFRKKK